MAKFKSMIFSEIRGSVNGLTFSRVKGAAIVRNRTVPVQPNTTAQSIVRSWFQEATNIFANLTVAEVDAWDNAISATSFNLTNSLGDVYTPSAKQLVTTIKMNFLSAGTTDDPEVSKFLGDPITPSVGFSTSTIVTGVGTPATLTSFNIDPSSDLTGAIIQVKATPPLKPSITNYKKYLRSLTNTVAGVSDVGANYTSLFPGLDWNEFTGYRVGLAYRAVNPNNGLASEWIYGELVTIPAPVI